MRLRDKNLRLIACAAFRLSFFTCDWSKTPKPKPTMASRYLPAPLHVYNRQSKEAASRLEERPKSTGRKPLPEKTIADGCGCHRVQMQRARSKLKQRALFAMIPLQPTTNAAAPRLHLLCSRSFFRPRPCEASRHDQLAAAATVCAAMHSAPWPSPRHNAGHVGQRGRRCSLPPCSIAAPAPFPLPHPRA